MITITTEKNPSEYKEAKLRVESEFIDRIRASIVIYRDEDGWHMEDFEPFDQWAKRERKRSIRPEVMARCREAAIAIVNLPLLNLTATDLEVKLFFSPLDNEDSSHWIASCSPIERLVAEGETVTEALVAINALLSSR